MNLIPPALRTGLGIAQSAFQGGAVNYNTNISTGDMQSLFERQAQIPWSIGDRTTFSDDNFYETEDGSLVRHTNETRKEFPNNAISQTAKAFMDSAGNVNLHDDASWVGNNPLAQLAYSYQNPLGSQGASHIEYNQPSMFHSPTAEFSDARYLNLKSDDPNEANWPQQIIGRGLNFLTGNNNNIVGTEFARGSLPYSQWSDKMKIQSGVPDFKQAMQMRRHIDTNTGQAKERLAINAGPSTGTGRTPFEPNPKQYTRTY